MDINKVAEKIGVPIDNWPGNCFYIATLCVKKGVVKGKARYGHFLGKIHQKSIFSKNQGLGFCRHGWVVLENGEIFDPTRWVFECAKPYIYIGKDNEYDIGGSKIKKSLIGAPPKFDPTAKIFTLDLSITALNVVKGILQDDRLENQFSLNQMFWLGNVHPQEFDSVAEEFYIYLKKINLSAFVPADYWDLVFDK